MKVSSLVTENQICFPVSCSVEEYIFTKVDLILIAYFRKAGMLY